MAGKRIPPKRRSFSWGKLTRTTETARLINYFLTCSHVFPHVFKAREVEGRTGSFENGNLACFLLRLLVEAAAWKADEQADRPSARLLCLQVVFGELTEKFLLSLRAAREIGQLSQLDKHKVSTNSSSSNYNKNSKNDNNVIQIVKIPHIYRQQHGTAEQKGWGGVCRFFN